MTDGEVRVRLVRKLADRLDGVDVSNQREGDVLDLPGRDAELLVGEGWAVPIRGTSREARVTSAAHHYAVAADRSKQRTVEELRRAREKMEKKRSEEQERRRAENRIREDLHDARSKTLNDSN